LEIGWLILYVIESLKNGSKLNYQIHSVSANVLCDESEATVTMCDVLLIPRSTYYHHIKKREDDERQAEEAYLQDF
jgi:hypothetical protein